jgi:hypothetical protein
VYQLCAENIKEVPERDPLRFGAPFTCALEERQEAGRDVGLRRAQSSRFAESGIARQGGPLISANLEPNGRFCSLKFVPSLSAVVDSLPRLLMEWRDEGGRDSNESSLARSAWKNKEERTIPNGTIDPVVPPG